ncbi:MAG: hypothetical protein R3C10_23705 [Pirellulales bacterium]
MKSCFALLVAISSFAFTANAQTGSLQDLSLALDSLPEITIYPAKEIVTLDPAKPTAEAVAVVGDRILAVGSLEELKAAAGKQSFTVDDTFADQVIVPGFVAQHDHPMLAAVTMTTKIIAIEDWVMPDKTYPAAKDRAEYLERLAKANDEIANPEEPLVTWGYHQYFHGELLKTDLDAISTTRPIIVWHRSAHEFYLNSAAEQKYGVTQVWYDNLKDSEKQQSDFDNAHYWEQGAFAVMPLIASAIATPEKVRTGLEFVEEYFHANGVTIGCEPGGLASKKMQDTQNAVLSDSATPFRWYYIIDGKTIAAFTGVPFDLSLYDISRTFGTNFVSNLVTSRLGHADRLRNLLDFSIRLTSDVAIGGENLVWSAAINLGTLAGSELLARYGKKLFGHAIAKYGGCFVAGTPIVTDVERGSLDCSSEHQGVALANRTKTTSIELVTLGSRVVTESPKELPYDEEFGEPDPSTWRKIDMLQHRLDGATIEMEILRPIWWIQAMGLRPGLEFEYSYPDLQSSGRAIVHAVAPCPPVSDGDGQVVIGRFVTRDASNLIRLSLDDGSEFTGTTNHRIWALDTNDWKPLGEIAEGDRVSTLDGEAIVGSVSYLREIEDVFNIWHGEHVYRILESGVLVHNADYVPDGAITRKLSALTQIPWGRYCDFGCEDVARQMRRRLVVTLLRSSLYGEVRWVRDRASTQSGKPTRLCFSMDG